MREEFFSQNFFSFKSSHFLLIFSLSSHLLDSNSNSTHRNGGGSYNGRDDAERSRAVGI
jgi:hypothetical protein